MKALIKKIMPHGLLAFYHRTLALIAAAWYGHPSEKLIVIGVTGTNGKSTTINIIGRILESTGARVGWTSTINFKVGEREWLNNMKMTMLGRFQLQKLLRDMVRAGTRYAVIETSSEGIAQSRHLGINYDVAVFLNLTPEHIEAHGGFENYKRAKGKLFEHLTRRPRKRIDGKEVPKTMVVNIDSEYAEYFLSFPADKKIGYTTLKSSNDKIQMTNEVVMARDIMIRSDGAAFTVGDTQFELPLRGDWNVSHALAAISVGQALGLSMDKLQTALRTMPQVPGRLEFIDEGQNFSVVVDYAPQPQSLAALYRFLERVPHQRLLHLLGATGGGRDKTRRPMFGKLAAQHAAVVVVTNEDPYDDDPMQIINDVASGAAAEGKKDGETLFRILDRREAIQKIISLAQPGNLVLLTGKGCEQAMVVKNNKKIPWDDREEVRKALRSRNV